MISYHRKRKKKKKKKDGAKSVEKNAREIHLRASVCVFVRRRGS